MYGKLYNSCTSQSYEDVVDCLALATAYTTYGLMPQKAKIKSPKADYKFILSQRKESPP